MPTPDPRIDAHIEAAAPFARPILEELRGRVHRACPGVEEGTRWGMPAFLHHGLLLTMSAFKAHCACTFHKHDLLFERPLGQGGMGSFGRLERVGDLPGRREFTRLVREAMRLNEEGALVPRRSPRPVVVPPELAAALEAEPAARRTFEGLSPSGQREYAEHIAGAKREETRLRRLERSLELLREGKGLNDRYRKKGK